MAKDLFADFAHSWFKHKGESINKGNLFKVYKRHFNLLMKYKYNEPDDYKKMAEVEALKKEISKMEYEYGFPRFSDIEKAREYFTKLEKSNDLTLARMSPSENPRISGNPPDFYKFDREL